MPSRVAVGAGAAELREGPWRRLGELRVAKLRHPRLWAFGFYLVLGLLTAGWYAISDPANVCACLGNSDTAIFVWSLGWWPHALAHGLDPIVTHYVWAPTGANLARDTVIPTAAIVMWPITALFGPLASYNVLSIASPVLTAFTTYLLCRRIVGRELPALAGGYLFGFGPYMFTQLSGHLNLTMVFLIPVMIHLALRRVEREISGRAYVIALAAVLVAQIGLSTEVLFTAVGLGAVMLVAARLLAPQPYGPRINNLVGETAAGGLLAVIVASPFLYYALIKGGAPQQWAEISNEFGLDLLNPLFPTHATWLGSGLFASIANTFENENIAEASGYLSIPIILAFVLWVIGTRRRFLARMLAIAAGLSFLAALGSHLHVVGESVIPLPYDLFRNAPVVRLLTPSRIVMYTALVVAIGVAAWLAEAHGRGHRAAARWALFALGAILIFPNVGAEIWGGAPSNPRFFKTAAYRRYLVPGETVLAFPFANAGVSMIWQAETGFYFRMSEGYLGHFVPEPFEKEQVVGELGSGKEINPQRLATFLTSHHVRDIIIEDNAVASLLPLTAELTDHGLSGLAAGGVLLYRVPPTGLPSS